MRLIMMGTGPFAVPTFESLLKSPYEVVALVTRPTAIVQTRGKSVSPPTPMRDIAQRFGLPIADPADINEPASREWLAELRPDLFVVCDYGQILSSETLAIPPLGGINLHGSLLPKYRGAAPINWAIWKGETETGVTVLHMTPRLDAGPCLTQRRVPIGPDETAAELEPKLARLGVHAVHEAVDLLAKWDRTSPIGEPQDKAQATRAPRLKKSDGLIDWKKSATEIFNQYRALQPWPGVFTYLTIPGKEPLRLILERVAIAQSSDSSHSSESALSPGAVVSTDEGRLIVGTSEGAIEIHRLQPAGKRSMDVREFLRGHKLHVGDLMGGGA